MIHLILLFALGFIIGYIVGAHDESAVMSYIKALYYEIKARLTKK